jgi:hypothetical protein
MCGDAAFARLRDALIREAAISESISGGPDAVRAIYVAITVASWVE